MEARQYAVVSYLNGPLAEFAVRLRAELAPGQAHLRAHITLLHPRTLPNPTETGIARVTDALIEIERAACAFGARPGPEGAPIRGARGAVAPSAPPHPPVFLPAEAGARH